MNRGLDRFQQLQRERAERARREAERLTPEERRERAQGSALDPPFPYRVAEFPEIYLVSADEIADRRAD
ncbi:MAG: hypothetical protein AAF236_14655 [Verrucomicrobiota bacterium]